MSARRGKAVNVFVRERMRSLTSHQAALVVAAMGVETNESKKNPLIAEAVKVASGYSDDLLALIPSENAAAHFQQQLQQKEYNGQRKARAKATQVTEHKQTHGT
jgi:hypothetical protein